MNPSCILYDNGFSVGGKTTIKLRNLMFCSYRKLSRCFPRSPKVSKMKGELQIL